MTVSAGDTVKQENFDVCFNRSVFVHLSCFSLNKKYSALQVSLHRRTQDPIIELNTVHVEVLDQEFVFFGVFNRSSSSDGTYISKWFALKIKKNLATIC